MDINSLLRPKEDNSKLLKKEINLLPSYIFAEKEKERQYNFVLLGLLAVFVCVLLLLTAKWQEMFMLQINIDGNTRRITTLEMVESDEKRIQEAEAEINAMKEYETRIDKSNSDIIAVLDLVKMIQSDDMEISGFIDGVASDKIAKTITIEGTAEESDSVAEFEGNLRISPLFSSVFVPEISETKAPNRAADDTITKFKVVCVLRNESGGEKQ